jgi:hypothetical protein
MRSRLLKDGSVVPELDNPITLVVKTKCPEKWMLIDLQTGEQYIGNHIGPIHWEKLEEQ